MGRMMMNLIDIWLKEFSTLAKFVYVKAKFASKNEIKFKKG